MLDAYNSSVGSWLALGPIGAALFIVLIVVMGILFVMYKSIDKICNHLGDMTSAIAESNIALKEVVINNARDQKELLRCITVLTDKVQDMYKKVIRIDSRIWDVINKKDDER